jgi:tetratricopeptide (TPR) repeat protein
VEAGQFDLARKELQNALNIYPDFPYALETYGLVESWQGNYQAAVPLLEKAFHLSQREDPNYDDMAVNLAGVYIQTDHMDRALDLLNREILESPRYARAWANRAVLRYKGHETALARADAEMAIRLDPDNRQARNLMQLLKTLNPPLSSR